MRIYRELSRQTGGTYNVILDDVHLKDLLHAQLEPPPSTLGTEPTLIKMGFPCHTGMMREKKFYLQAGVENTAM